MLNIVVVLQIGVNEDNYVVTSSEDKIRADGDVGRVGNLGKKVSSICLIYLGILSFAFLKFCKVHIKKEPHYILPFSLFFKIFQ